MQFPKNVLVCYQGGGYDGCFWEWNFFYFNEEREFVDIYSSGCAGITDPDKAYQMYRDVKSGKETGNVFRVTARSQMHTFQAEYNPGLVVGVVKALLDAYPYDVCKAHVACDDCGLDIDDLDCEVRYVDYSSDHVLQRCSGPITPKSKLCYECFDNGCCQECRENGYDDETSYDPDGLDKDGLCEFHSKQKIIMYLEEGRVVKHEDTSEMHELWNVIQQGEKTMKIARTYHPDFALRNADAHKEGVSKVKDEIVEVWESLMEWADSYILDDTPSAPCPDSFPLALALA